MINSTADHRKATTLNLSLQSFYSYSSQEAVVTGLTADRMLHLITVPVNVECFTVSASTCVMQQRLINFKGLWQRNGK